MDDSDSDEPDVDAPPLLGHGLAECFTDPVAPAHRVAADCAVVLDACVDHLVSGRVRLPKAARACARLQEAWGERWVAWNETSTDDTAQVVLSDLAWVASCFLQVCSRPAWQKQQAQSPLGRDEACQVQQDLRRCMREAHHSWEAFQQWARRLPRLLEATCRLQCYSLSHFDAGLVEDRPEAPTHLAHGDPSGAGARYADIDVHADYKDPGWEAETKGTAAVAAAAAPPPDAAPAQPGPPVLQPYRFASMASRLFYMWGVHHGVLRAHHVDDEAWAHGHAGMTPQLHTMLRFRSSHGLLRRVNDLHLWRETPLGAWEMARRYRPGGWHNVEARTVLLEELGQDATSALMEAAQQKMEATFQLDETTRRPPPDLPWTRLHDTWLLVLWHRWLRTELQLDFLYDCVVQSHELVQKQDLLVTLEARCPGGYPRLPVVVEVCGAWWVSYLPEDLDPLHPQDNQLPRLQRCPGLRDALDAWAYRVCRPPCQGLTVDNLKLGRVLKKVLPSVGP